MARPHRNRRKAGPEAPLPRGTYGLAAAVVATAVVVAAAAIAAAVPAAAAAAQQDDDQDDPQAAVAAKTVIAETHCRLTSLALTDLFYAEGAIVVPAGHCFSFG